MQRSFACLLSLCHGYGKIGVKIRVGSAIASIVFEGLETKESIQLDLEPQGGDES